jgi:acyl-CoA thioester hydrolase
MNYLTYLEEYPVVVERNLEWGDMDAMGHVNNIIYFRLFENARIAYFQKVYINDRIKDAGIGPILKSTSCIYRVPLTFPDVVFTGAKVIKLDTDRFTMKYAVYSQKHQRIAAEGEGVVVLFNYWTQEKTPLSPDIIQAIKLLV